MARGQVFIYLDQLTCVLPPTPSCTKLLDRDADEANDEKNEQNTLLIPYAYSSCKTKN